MTTKRSKVQIIAALMGNAYLPGFIRGGIYQGGLKRVCLPFLNCYSCPGALGACPVGAIQSTAVVTQRISLYVSGLVIAFGALGGRFICGWLCPFGFIQELVGRVSPIKIPLPKSLLRLKYLVLILTVLLPLLLVEPVTGIASPYFCKYLCPAGTLEAGIPLLLLNTSLRGLIGGLFIWKVGMLLVFLAAMVLTWRPFCRVLCPLGAFYALCNRVSLFQLRVDLTTCSGCGACQNRCPAQIPIWKEPASQECIRCLECLDSCPSGSLYWSTPLGTSKHKQKATGAERRGL